MDIKNGLLVILLLVSVTTYADSRIEIGSGRSYFGRMPDGTWCQDAFGCAISTQAKYYSLGASFKTSRYTRLSINYENFGATKGDVSVLPDDANYNPKGDDGGCFGKCLPKTRLIEYGNGYGVSILGHLEHQYGNLSVSLGAGPLVYRSSLVVQAIDDCLGWNEDHQCTNGTHSYTQNQMTANHITAKAELSIWYRNRVAIVAGFIPGYTENAEYAGFHKGVKTLSLKVGL